MSGEILGVVRASSWGDLFDCSYRWYWKHEGGLRMPSGPAAHLGTAIHEGAALFDAARIDGLEVTVEEAARAAHAYVTDPAAEVDWHGEDDLTPKIAGQLAIILTTRYCQQIAPTREYVAVELHVPALDIETGHGVVRVTGSTDRVRRDPGDRLGISDLKTGGKAVERTDRGELRAVTKGHHLQLGIYQLMAEHSMQVPIEAPAEIIGLATTARADVATAQVADVRTPLVGDDTFPGLLAVAGQLLRAGLFPPNPKSTLCSPRYCPAYGGRCKYHD